MPRIEKSEAEWKEELSEEEFRVAREGGTERAFTGRYWDHHEDGIYECSSCGTPLFDSSAKYDSGSGWPSFHDVVDEENIRKEADDSLGMRRTEVRCAACDAHLGHLFPDGPAPSGLRYCINSASLRFRPRDEGKREEVEEQLGLEGEDRRAGPGANPLT